MKDFHRSFICRSTETGKKGHKSKHNSNKNEICKCYAPFLKLHYYDCPVARKPCPIHGSPYRHCVKNEKTEKKENMVISFHPSSKTDKLFRPIKNLLAHCNPETKINLEYYALNNSVTKDGMKHRQVQTNPEEFKKSLGSNVFVEKTKSFVTDKTNRMKRLKQCFHSPCNSVVTRTRSEVTIKNKINKNFYEIAEHAAVATNVPKEPSAVYLYEKTKWTSSNKLDSSDWERSSEDKVESDFLTVTKQVENKVIDHKIFEIKHKKEFGDTRFTKLPRQSPFVYSSYNIEQTKNAPANLGTKVQPVPNQKGLEKYSSDNKLIKSKIEEEEISSSEKSQSSSTGSIYFTPAILIPPGLENDTSDESRYADDLIKERPNSLHEEVKAGDSTVNKNAQTETPVFGKTPYEISTSEESTETKGFESEKESMSLKQEKGVGSGNLSSSDKFITTPEKSPSLTSKSSIKNTYIKTDISQTTNKPVNKSTQVCLLNSPAEEEGEDLFDKEFYNKKEKSKPAVWKDTRKSFRVQTDEVQKKEISLLYDGMRNVADKLIQTEPVIMKDVQVETMVAKKNKSEMTYWTAVKCIQTSFTLSDSQSQSQEGEFTSEPHVSYAARSYTRPDSNRGTDRSPWKTSLSYGDLYNEQKSHPESENLISIHHICLCENSETSTSDSDFNSYEKIGKPGESDTKPMIQKKNERRPSAIKIDTMSKGEQTSLSDLSELARMVDQFFDKMSREAFKSCECEKIKKRDSKINQGIQADSFKCVKKPKINMVDAETQTTFKVILDLSSEEEKTKVHQNVNPQDNTGYVFVCKICRRKLNTVDSDSSEKAATSKKQVGFISVGTSTDGFVEKRSIGICVSDHLTVKCLIKNRAVCASQCVSTNDMYNASSTKAPLPEAKSFFLLNRNKETTTDCSVNMSSIKCPIASGQSTSAPRPDPKDKPVEEEPETTNQTKEKKIIKKPQKSDDWKCTNYSILSETFERRTVYKPPVTRKPKPEAGNVKSGIPTAAGSNRKTINFKDKVSDKYSLNTRAVFTQGTNKLTFKPQKESYAPRITYNRNTICLCDCADTCDGKPAKQKLRTEFRTSNKVFRASDQKPPLPKKAQPGESSAQTKSNAPKSTSAKPSGEKKFIFPAIIRPIWYTDFRKTLQMIKNCQGLHESKSSILKQKRLFEEEDDLPGGKKIKGRDNGSGESYECEQSVLALNGRHIIDMKESTGLVWVPSSAQQLSKAEARSASLLKGTQSESKVATTCLQNSALIKGFNKRSANVLSVKSCRLKPVQVNEKHPFRKLFECRLCKSLNFLKPDQKDSLKNEQPSEGSFGYESPRGKNETLVLQDDNYRPTNWVFTPQADEEFVVEYSFSSGSSNSTDLTENCDFVDDECVAKNKGTELSFVSPPGEQADAFSNLAHGSQSFDLFWFGSDSRKK